jgi:hypothetical protein
MAQSSPQRRRYLAARRRGLSQSEAMGEVGISRSSAWRYDQLFNQEEAERAALRDRVKAGRATRESDDDEALREATVKDVTIEGRIPKPPWGDLQDGTRIAPSAQEPLVEDGSFPAGLLERRQRAASQGASQGGAAPRPNPRAVIVMRGVMPDSQDMSGTRSRPFLPEDPPTFLGGVV